jgi:hypothetical protein
MFEPCCDVSTRHMNSENMAKADVPDSTHRLTKHWKWLTACHTLQPQVPVVGSVITKSTNTLPSNYIFDIFTSGALGNMSTHWKKNNNNFSLMQLPQSHVSGGWGCLGLG